MSNNIDVSMRLRLVNQVSKPAEEAERDLKELKNAADRIGKSTPGNLGRELDKLGTSATEAKGKIGAIGSEAEEVRRRIGRIDDGAFAGLKADAASAKAAINEVGQAATAAEQKIRQMRGYSAMSVPGGRLIADGRWQTQTHAPRSGAVTNAAEGVLDQFGVPVVLGAGGAYLAGALPAAALVAGGAAVNAAAGDEQRSDALRASGGYDEEQQKKFDQSMGRSGARHGVGMSGAQDVFGVLQAGGLSSADAAAMTDSAIKFSVGTKADPTDAANLTIALRTLMGIDADKMTSAYDTIAVGGNNGQFEIKDMARNFPSIFARMAARGSRGLQGIRTAAAMSQPIAEVSGSNDQAATAFEAMLDDLGASDVRERMKKYGLDPWQEMGAAKARGEDPVLGVLKRIREVFGKNDEGFADVFRNNTAAPAFRAIMDNIEKIDQLVGKMDGASGVVDKSYDVNTDNFNSQRDRLSANVGQNIKELAAPILPLLTSAFRAAAEQMERSRENQSKNPLSIVPGHDVTEGLMKFWLSNSASGPGQPSGWERFFFGKAAEPGFNLKEQLGIDLKPAAQTSMQGYNDALAQEGQKAASEAQAIAERIRASLGFTVSPTISPVIVQPGQQNTANSPAPQQHSSLQPTGNYRLTQNITSPNPQHAAARAARLQARQIQQAQARSLYDTGRRLA